MSQPVEPGSRQPSAFPRWLLFGVGASVLAMVACALGAALFLALGPSLSVRRSPGGAPQTPARPEDPGAPARYTFTTSGLEQFSSYEARYDVLLDGVENNQPFSAIFEINVASQGEPALLELDSTMGALEDAAGDGPGRFNEHLLFIEDHLYITQDVGGGILCEVLPTPGADWERPRSIEDLADQTILFADLPLIDEWLAGTPALERAGANQDINGVESRRYDGQGVAMSVTMLDEVLEMEDATLSVWVAREGGYVSRVALRGNFTLADQPASGTLSIDYELLSHDLPLERQPPAGCEAS